MEKQGHGVEKSPEGKSELQYLAILLQCWDADSMCRSYGGGGWCIIKPFHHSNIDIIFYAFLVSLVTAGGVLFGWCPSVSLV